MATNRSRRGRGEGSIYQESSGLWAASVTVGYDEAGKRRRKAVRGKTKADVLAKLDALKSTAITNDLAGQENLTVGEFLDRWLEGRLSKKELRSTTYDLYKLRITRQIKPHLGGVKLARLRPLHVEALFKRLADAGQSPRTVAMVFEILRAACNKAVEWHTIPIAPTDGVTAPRRIKYKPRPLSPEQVLALFRAAAKDRLFALYVVAATTGARSGELFALTWEDVDLKAKTARIDKTLIELRGKFSVGETKTEKSRRLIRLPEIALEALREHRKRMLAKGTLGPLVFCDRRRPRKDGAPRDHNPEGYLRRSAVRRRFKALLRAAGLPEIRFHDLRHTVGSTLLAGGIHPKIASELLGHSQTTTTLEIYSHVLPGIGDAAAREMDRALSGYSLATPDQKQGDKK